MHDGDIDSDPEDDEDWPSLVAGMPGGLAQPHRGQPKWVRQSHVLREEFRTYWEAADWHSQPWTRPLVGPPPLIIGVTTARARDLVDFAAIAQCRKIGCTPRALAQSPALRSRVADDLYVDISQSHKRRPWKKGRAPTATTAIKLFSFSEDRVLLEEELFAAYGRHVEVDAMRAAGISRADARNLVGDCMAVQPVATILHCMVVSCAKSLPGMLDASLAQPCRGQRA